MVELQSALNDSQTRLKESETGWESARKHQSMLGKDKHELEVKVQEAEKKLEAIKREKVALEQKLHHAPVSGVQSLALIVSGPLPQHSPWTAHTLPTDTMPADDRARDDCQERTTPQSHPGERNGPHQSEEP